MAKTKANLVSLHMHATPLLNMLPASLLKAVAKNYLYYYLLIYEM
jgi:hypothetical protein